MTLLDRVEASRDYWMDGPWESPRRMRERQMRAQLAKTQREVDAWDRREDARLWYRRLRACDSVYLGQPNPAVERAKAAFDVMMASL